MNLTSLLIVAVVLSISTLVLLVIKAKIHPFFSIMAATFVFALFSRMGADKALEAFSSGLGDTVAGIGIVIAIGTVTGVLLEKCGAAESMAKAILRITGKKYAALGLAITGFFVSIPVFCDSAFVILAPIAKRLSKDTKTSMTTMAVALAMGLHTTHMLLPPTPGPLAVSGIVGADLGLVIGIGFIIAIPVMLAGYIVAKKFGSKPQFEYFISDDEFTEFIDEENKNIPSTIEAFIPILVPSILMIIKTVVDFKYKDLETNGFVKFVQFIGVPIIALLIGMLLALKTYRKLRPNDNTVCSFEGEFGEALKTAGQIVLIVGAGGAFGGVLKASPLKELLVSTFSSMNIGIFAPFIIGAIFRTAIGSGTVAMITAATILTPMIDALGFGSPLGRVVAMIACAAGGFMVFHGNDDFFWVVTSTSEMEPSKAYKILPLASIFQSITALACAFILQMILL
ncbi:GntP family permease [Clostridium brassicae]|uniref:GntP family permease n=1 Tax=Clostridium brassicae TaxID=2999072 RepID=A0ABT4D4F8_9CLOT|nr:GntP family permease [Clostridium brassicae]MCY6957164.1 GntP family permease [Clostridium brassicae]